MRGKCRTRALLASTPLVVVVLVDMVSMLSGKKLRICGLSVIKVNPAKARDEETSSWLSFKRDVEVYAGYDGNLPALERSYIRMYPSRAEKLSRKDSAHAIRLSHSAFYVSVSPATSPIAK